MRSTVRFLIYLAGVVFLSWHYYSIKASLDVLSLLVFVTFFCLGVSTLASYASARLPGRNR
jgi:hypothetical protein